jgi:hypothetical protein
MLCLISYHYKHNDTKSQCFITKDSPPVSCGTDKERNEADVSPLFRTFTPKTPWPEYTNEPYRPSGRRLSAKLVPTFADRECHVVSATDPYDRILGSLDRSRYFFRRLSGPRTYTPGNNTKIVILRLHTPVIHDKRIQFKRP